MKALPLVLLLSTLSFSCSETKVATFDDVRLPVARNAMTFWSGGRPNAVLTIDQDGSRAQIYLDRRATAEAAIRAIKLLEAAKIPNYEFIVLIEEGPSSDPVKHHSLCLEMPDPALKTALQDQAF